MESQDLVIQSSQMLNELFKFAKELDKSQLKKDATRILDKIDKTLEDADSIVSLCFNQVWTFFILGT